MPLAFYEQDHKTIVRVSPPSQVDDYPNGTVTYLAAEQAAKTAGATFLLFNLSEDPNVLILQQNKNGFDKKRLVGLSPLFAHYPTIYPSAQVVMKPIPQIIIKDPQDILMMRLTNIDRFF